jgi:hypothetical protein
MPPTSTNSSLFPEFYFSIVIGCALFVAPPIILGCAIKKASQEQQAATPKEIDPTIRHKDKP